VERLTPILSQNNSALNLSKEVKTKIKESEAYKKYGSVLENKTPVSKIKIEKFSSAATR